MTSTALASFQRKAFATEAALYGKDCTIAGKSVRLLLRKVDALEAATGGFEEGGGELSAQFQGPTPPAVHALVVVGAKGYRILSVVSSGGERHSLTLRPTGSSK